MKGYLTQAQVIAKYKKGRMTLYRWRKREKVKWKKIGPAVMYLQSSIEKLLK